MTKLSPKKNNYMQTSTGKVANFLLPEVEVTAQSPTGSDWEDRNRYKAYKGRRYISEGRLEAKPLALGLAGLTALPGITALAPAVSATLNNPYVNAVLTADGVRNALSGEGVLKTYRLAKEGDYWGATKSGAIDALNLWGGYGLLKTGTNAFKNRYLFLQTPNSFTRGIGSEKGLEDLRVSGKIRGSQGTEVSAKEFGKEMRRHKDEWNALEQEFPGIKQRWFRRELSEPEFTAINTKFTLLENNKAIVSETKPRILLKKKSLFSSEDFDNPGSGSFENRGTKTYQDYLRDSKAEGVGVTHDLYWKDDPMAYFYDDGRNPITSGHTYANSNYGVKIDNIDLYNPYIHTAHQHYTTQGPVRLQDPNVTVYGKGPFNSTIRLDKNTFKPLYVLDFKNLFTKLIPKRRGIDPNNFYSNIGIDANLGRLTINNSDNLFIGGLLLDDLPILALNIESVGLAKGSANDIQSLYQILNNNGKGVKYTAPLQINPELAKGVGAALGTSSGTSYRHGMFIVNGYPGKRLENGVHTVLVNDFGDPKYRGITEQMINKLKLAYPNIEFIPYNLAPNYYNKYYNIAPKVKVDKPILSNPESNLFLNIDTQQLPPPPEEINLIF